MGMMNFQNFSEFFFFKKIKLIILVDVMREFTCVCVYAKIRDRD